VPARFDRERLRRQLHGLLADGPSSTTEIAKRLGISRPAAGYIVKELGAELLVTGRARFTRYDLLRRVDGLDRFPVYEVGEDGTSRLLDVLRPVGLRGFYAEHAGARFPDLPWWLNDLRPSGFLGRLIPIQDPTLRSDILLWTSDDVLAYLARSGTNSVGNLVVGDAAFRRMLEGADMEPAVPRRGRAARYPQLARSVLQLGVPGSSAGGEQPKFLVRRDDTVPVLVKFSPPMTDTVGRRVADLLVAEHIAHETLRRVGVPASVSTVIDASGQRFLEVERFDRSLRGRRGVVSLLALDLGFVGSSLDSWSVTAEALAAQGILRADTVTQVRWLEWFGRLIANSDMHGANLSLFREGLTLGELAPSYDMLPMAYAPRLNQVIPRSIDLPIPSPRDGDVFPTALQAALSFWEEVADRAEVTDDFRAIAREHRRQGDTLLKIARQLPG
jgi:hypothetical protein